jgi:hypothetical protein
MSLKEKVFGRYLRFLGLNFTPRTFKESVISFEKSTPILLVGLPRSGTSLAQIIFNHFQQVYLAYEATNEPFIYEKNTYKLSAFFYESLRQAEHIQKISPEMQKSKLVKKPPHMHQYKYLGNKTIFSTSKKYQDKLTKLINNNEKIKVIFISRDPRDRLLSILKWKDKRNQLFKNTIEHTTEIQDIARIENQRSNDFLKFTQRFQNNPNVLTIPYETFVSDKSSLTQISKFLDINDFSDVEEYFDKNVFSKSVGNWVDNMEPKVREIIEQECSTIIK